MKYNKKEICITLFILFLSFLFMMNSPLNIITRGQSAIDSSVFRYIGMLISKGYTPYLNTFDHKGPIIYLLNYFGFMINKTCGIWFIEIIFMFITFYFIYKIAKLKTKSYLALTVLLLSTVNLFIYFEGGNFVEEYALTFITISLYIFFDYLLNDKITKLRIIVCGFCFACVFLLRVNMIPCWIVFCIAILIKCIKEKDYKKLINYVLNFLMGILIVVIPIFLWLISKNAFGKFIDDYFIFNMKYTANVGMFGKLSTLIFFTINILIMFSIFINIYAIVKEKKKDIFIINLIYILLSLLMTGLSGRKYLHYGMILIPSLVIPFTYFVNLIGKNTNKKMFAIVIIYLLVAIVLPQWLVTLKNTSLSVIKEINNISPINSEFLKINELIQENTTKKDKITVYGNLDYIYYLSNRLSASKYSYQLPIGEVNPKIFDEYFKELQKNKPKVIVSVNKPDKRMKNFIKKYSYERLKNSNEKIFVYKLNKNK